MGRVLENVTLEDTIYDSENTTNKLDDQFINDSLARAQGNMGVEGDGNTVTNGNVTLEPGESARFILPQVQSPDNGYHYNNVVATGDIPQEHGGGTVNDDDPAWSVTPVINITKYINSKDANVKDDAVWINDTVMTVTFTAVNNGAVALDNVLITDVEYDPEDTDAPLDVQEINQKLIGATGILNGSNVTNGDFRLEPGQSAEFILDDVAAPVSAEYHYNNATVTGTTDPTVVHPGGISVSDQDPAWSFSSPDSFPLPETGRTDMVVIALIGVTLLVLTGTGAAVIITRRNTIS